MEDKDFSDKIEVALRDVISEMEDYEEGDILVDWVVVAYVTNADKEKAGAYPMLFSNGEMPHYRARGLLVTGLENLKGMEE